MVAGELLLYQILGAAYVGQEAAYDSEQRVEALGGEHRVAAVEGGARRQPVVDALIEGTRAGEGYESRVEGRRQVLEVQQLLPRCPRGAVGKGGLGIYRAPRHLEV